MKDTFQRQSKVLENNNILLQTTHNLTSELVCKWRTEQALGEITKEKIYYEFQRTGNCGKPSSLSVLKRQNTFELYMTNNKNHIKFNS